MSAVTDAAGETRTEMRSLIERSWKRSTACGLERGTELRLPHDEFDDDSRLIRAAQPVLERLITTMADTRHSLLLADPQARIIHRWVGAKSLYVPLDNACIAPGFEFNEEFAGTNGVGTALEESLAVTVHADEHYAEPLRRFSCVGVPIRNPIRGNIEGVLDFTCLAQDFHPLMTPLLVEVAKHIETRFSQHSSESESALLECFVRTNRSYRGPVVGMRPNMFLTNTAAAEQSGVADQAVLWDIACDFARCGRTDGVIELKCGRYSVKLQLVNEHLGAAGGVVLRLHPEVSARPVRRFASLPTSQTSLARSGRSPQWKQLLERIDELAASKDPVAFTGQDGAGKLWTAKRLGALRGGGVRLFDAALERGAAQESLVGRCRNALDAGGSVIVRRVDELAMPVRAELSALVRTGTIPMSMIVTCTDDPRDAVSTVLAGFAHQVWLPPLAQRLEDIVDVVPELLAALAPDRVVTCALSAQQVLSRYSWPGNVSELRAVLASALSDLPGNQIDVMHLPAWLRKNATARPLTPYERSERDLIIDMLASVGNNRAEAARVLGIGRATLYRKMRALGIANGNELVG